MGKLGKPRQIDITVKDFHRYTVLEFYGLDSSRSSRWVCLCDCGNVKVVGGTELRSGIVKSCGCWRDDVARSRIGPLNTKWIEDRSYD